MGSGEHGKVGPSIGLVPEGVEQILQRRQENFLVVLFDRQRNSGIVDVLRGEAKVDVFGLLREAQSGHLVLQKVFYGLDIVVGRFFNSLDFQSIGL